MVLSKKQVGVLNSWLARTYRDGARTRLPKPSPTTSPTMLQQTFSDAVQLEHERQDHHRQTWSERGRLNWQICQHEMCLRFQTAYRTDNTDTEA